jgi:predicted hotdog family 3-hydroxylacyl-ACP dehydratase
MKLAALLAVLALAGCSTKKHRPPPAPAEPAAEPVAAAPAPSPAPAPTVAAPVAAPDLALPADFPAECLAYAALVDKAAACDALGAARDGLVAAYRELRTAWPNVPAPQRASVAAQCKAQADSLRSAAAATCRL